MNTECRFFTGYKPCNRFSSCDSHCPKQDVPSLRVLLVHLGAMGAVVRSTALLKAIHRKYPKCHLTWITDPPSQQLLAGHPLIDQVLTTEQAGLLELSAQTFDVALVVDKSKKAFGVLQNTRVDQIFGFRGDSRTGSVLPATAAAQELWEIGLSDAQKFFRNQKTEIQLVHEALELGPYVHDDYFLHLNGTEHEQIQERKKSWQRQKNQIVLGLNTGASATIAAKKLSVQNHRSLIAKLQAQGYENIVLLGGPEDHERNQLIADGFEIISSPTQGGLRDGLCSVAACDVVVSGDSLGMHLAIAAQRYVIAWFGPTCAHEINFFNRGQAILSKASCSPCWKRDCQQPVMCYDRVDFQEIIKAIESGEAYCKTQQPSISRQLNLENRAQF